MAQSPFLGVYKTEEGQIIDAVSGSSVSAADIVPKMEPFYGRFLDAQGNEHDVSELFSGGGGGGTGTTNHAALQNLSYANSGHTGFATAAQGALAETALQDTDKAAMVSSVEYNPNTREIVTTMGDGSSGTSSTIPQASDTVNGLMTPADRASITELTSDVQSLKEGGVWREEFATYADLTAAYPALDVSSTNWFVNDYVECLADESPTTTLHTQGQPSRYRVTVNSDETVKTLVFQRDFLTGEAVNVQLATQAAPGIVKGADVNGKIFVETDGTMSMVGYDDLVEEDTALNASLAGKVDNDNIQTDEAISLRTEVTGELQFAGADGVYRDAGIVAGALIPDYSKRETINRIPTNNGSWIVDRSGFVYCAMSSNGGVGLMRISINGVTDSLTMLLEGSGRNSGTTIPVKKGDVVTLSFVPTDTPGVFFSSSCFYIPSRAMAPVIYGVIPDYSRRETANHISTNHGNWVVDADGFVNVQIDPTNAVGFSYIVLNGVTLYYAGNVSEIFPVKKGDTIELWATASSTTFRCSYIPARAFDELEIPTKVIGNVLPDYGNTESTNRITTNNGTWTVADDGFVRCYIQGTGNNGIFINDVEVGGSFLGATVMNALRNTFPVKKGDVVRLYCNGTFTICSCYFIRPRHFDMDLMNSPHLWPTDGTELEFADGSFGRRFTGTITAAVNVRSNIILSVLGSCYIIESGGYWEAASRYQVGMYSNTLVINHMFYVKTTGALTLSTESSTQARTNAPYDVWLRYTK